MSSPFGEPDVFFLVQSTGGRTSGSLQSSGGFAFFKTHPKINMETKTIPDAQCMVYLPTFTIQIN